MSTNEKILQEIKSGFRDKNIKFTDLQKILIVLGFQYKLEVRDE